MRRPQAGEHPPYFEGYVRLVPDGDILEHLLRQGEELLRLVEGLDEPLLLYRYAPGKWSVKELLGHLVDTERIFTTRALCFARGERQSLPGMDENAYAAEGQFDVRPIGDLLTEMRAVRQASVALFRGLPPESHDRRGVANAWEFSVRSVPWLIAGHELHHVGVLRERYLQR